MKKQHLKIVLITLGVHSLYFFMFPTSMKINRDAPVPRPMKVVTKEIFSTKARTVEFKSEATISKAKINSFLPKASPPKKTIKKKTVQKKTPEKKPSPKSVKSVRGKLDKNVANIKARSYPKATPGARKPTKVPDLVGEEKHSYLQKISYSLKEWLTLPEKGTVKLTITVQANGKIATINIVSSESEKKPGIPKNSTERHPAAYF